MSHHRHRGLNRLGLPYLGALSECTGVFTEIQGIKSSKKLKSPEGEPSVYISPTMGSKRSSYETALATGNMVRSQISMGVKAQRFLCSSVSPVLSFLFRELLASYSWRFKSKNKFWQQNLCNRTRICQDQTFQSHMVWSGGHIVTHRPQSQHLDPVILLLEVAVYTWRPLMLRCCFSIIIIIIRPNSNLFLRCEGVCPHVLWWTETIFTENSCFGFSFFLHLWPWSSISGL